MLQLQKWQTLKVDPQLTDLQQMIIQAASGAWTGVGGGFNPIFTFITDWYGSVYVCKKSMSKSWGDGRETGCICVLHSGFTFDIQH